MKIKTLTAHTTVFSRDDEPETFLSSFLEFNEAGQPLLSEAHTREGQLESKTRMEYNNLGLLICQKEFFEDEEVSEETLLEYDTNQQLIHSHTTYSDGSETHKRYNRDTEKDRLEITATNEDNELESREVSWIFPDGRLRKKEIFDEEDLLQHIIENEYDDQDRLVRQIERDGKGVIQIESLLEYDDAGNLIKQMSLTGTRKLTSKMVQTFDENGRVIEQQIGGIHSIKTIYEDENRIRREERYLQGQLESMTEQLFDENGFLVEEKQPGRETKYHYTFFS
jgi:hypothetical protein